MRPTLALTSIEAVALPHRGGHRCSDGKWYNDQAGSRTPCAVTTHLETARTQVERLATQVSQAALDDEAAAHVAEAMTGLVMAELATEDREGWTKTASMAIEGLAQWLDRDPVLEAKAAALRERLASAGLEVTPPYPDAPINPHANAPWEAP